MIAALFVQTNGAYFGLPDVDPWDEARDARKYSGPHPVVAHPPCSKRPPALISWCGNHIASGEKRPRLGKKEASATPPAFRELLLSIARSAGGAS